MKVKVLVSTILIFCVQTIFATADGPDFFRVYGVKQGDSLNIRAQPNATAKIIGTIPFDATGIENTGQLWPPYHADSPPSPENLVGSTFSEDEKKALFAGNIWVKVKYLDIKGWVRLKFLVEDEGQ